ncbi:MAG: preprotein translocase subunit YajC [Candidatus Omnitrophota bacterium]|jgi:preprotein translocase subunit YajC
MQGPNGGILQIVPLIFIFGIFYFLIIRPQQKKQKDHLAMIQNIKKNDEVVTVGGVHGTVINVKEKTFIVRIDENVKVEIDKSSVAYIKKVRQ